jgi:hypothetical protein
MPNVTCPHCDAQLNTSESVGTNVQCSACGRTFDIVAEEEDGFANMETGERRERRYEKKSGTHPVVILAAWAMIGLFILGLVAGGVWWKQHAELEALDQERLNEAWRYVELGISTDSAYEKIAVIMARHPTWPRGGPNPAKKR